MCEHNFNYAGVRYCDGANSMPGTGARKRYYAHVYFCSKCTETRGVPIEDPRSYDGRPLWHTYEKPRFDATPGTVEQCGVPLHDQR